MLLTISQAPYFTSGLMLGLALFASLLFVTQIWITGADTQDISHSTLALGYAALSGLLPLLGLRHDRRARETLLSID